jgi:hypothetical protein
MAAVGTAIACPSLMAALITSLPARRSTRTARATPAPDKTASIRGSATDEARSRADLELPRPVCFTLS